MEQKDNFKLLAEYNQWINLQFYQAAAQLTQPQLDKSREPILDQSAAPSTIFWLEILSG